MAEVTLEALQQFMIENGCKVKSSEAIEFFRLNYVGKISDVTKNKDLFKKFMEELTSAYINETGERYLMLKRQYMVLLNSPHPYAAQRGTFKLSPRPSPRVRRAVTERSATTSLSTPSSPQSTYVPLSLPNSLAVPSLPPMCIVPHETMTDGQSPDSITTPVSIVCSTPDVLPSPVLSAYDSDEFDDEYYYDDEFDDMELGSVGGCSSNQLEPSQKEWIYKAAIGDVNSVTRLLLQDRTLVKYKDFISGYTGLHWAAKLGQVDMAHVLLAADIDINARAFNGMTALHIAAQCGHDTVVDLLVKERADKFVRDYNGRYPLFYISTKCTEKTRELLSPAIPRSQKPRSHHSVVPARALTPVSKPTNFSLRRHKREKSDTSTPEYRSKTLNSNFKYQTLGGKNSSHKRSLSGLKIDHITLDGCSDAGATLVRSKEEALGSLCSNSTMSPKSVKRISLGTPLSALYDMEPLLLHESLSKLNQVAWDLPEEGRDEEEERDWKRSSLLCCCPRRRRKRKRRCSV